jgi:aminoglycoside phosphotransferase (APT) family kinase protein
LHSGNASSASGAIHEQIERLRGCLETASARLTAEGLTKNRAPLEKLLAWEIEFYDRSAQFKASSVPSIDEPLTQEMLQTYLRRRFPKRPQMRVVDFKPLIGGLQKLTIVFDTEDEAGNSESLVLRGERPDRFVTLDFGLIADEYEVVKVAFAAGLPIAEPLWLETDAAELGRRFMVSRKVLGINYGHATGVIDIPEDIAKSFVVSLAHLNSVPLEAHAEAISRSRLARWMEFECSAENTLANVHYWRNLPVERYGASPAVGVLYTWLINNVPQEKVPMCLLHCDYGPHNVLIHDRKVSGILDWESARIGNPAEDLAYFLQSTAGQINRDKAIGWYQAAGGPPISAERLRYFEVFNVLKSTVACLGARAFFAGDASARNDWVPLALRYIQYTLSLVWRRLDEKTSS